MNHKPEHNLKTGLINYCQVCGSNNLEFVIDLGHQPPCDSLLTSSQLSHPETSYPLRMYRCCECSLAQIDYVVDPEILFYREYPYRSGITPTLANNLRNTGFSAIKKFGLNKGDLAIDIGSNDGTLLSSFKDAGLRVVGVEPTDVAKISIANGIPAIQEFFSEKVAQEIINEHGQAAVVTAANMFAHVKNLGDLIRGVELLLKEGGVFITESHYLQSLLDTVQYDSVYHEHLKYYTLKSLIKLFEYYDFTVVDVELIENYGGSIRVYAAKGKNGEVNPSVQKILDKELTSGLYASMPFTRFSAAVIKSRIQLKKLVIAAKEENKSLVGVGCPGRSSTLVNYCAIDKELMSCIAEQSSSLKLGLYLPGMHIPIVDEEVLFQNQPDYVLLLSWHYWEPIVKKLRAKGLRSKVIIPLPEVRVIE